MINTIYNSTKNQPKASLLPLAPEEVQLPPSLAHFVMAGLNLASDATIPHPALMGSALSTRVVRTSFMIPSASATMMSIHLAMTTTGSLLYKTAIGDFADTLNAAWTLVAADEDATLYGYCGCPVSLTMGLFTNESPSSATTLSRISLAESSHTNPSTAVTSSNFTAQCKDSNFISKAVAHQGIRTLWLNPRPEPVVFNRRITDCSESAMSQTICTLNNTETFLYSDGTSVPHTTTTIMIMNVHQPGSFSAVSLPINVFAPGYAKLVCAYKIFLEGLPVGVPLMISTKAMVAVKPQHAYAKMLLPDPLFYNPGSSDLLSNFIQLIATSDFPLVWSESMINNEAIVTGLGKASMGWLKVVWDFFKPILWDAAKTTASKIFGIGSASMKKVLLKNSLITEKRADIAIRRSVTTGASSQLKDGLAPYCYPVLQDIKNIMASSAGVHVKSIGDSIGIHSTPEGLTVYGYVNQEPFSMLWEPDRVSFDELEEETKKTIGSASMDDIPTGHYFKGFIGVERDYLTSAQELVLTNNTKLLRSRSLKIAPSISQMLYLLLSMINAYKYPETPPPGKKTQYDLDQVNCFMLNMFMKEAKDLFSGLPLMAKPLRWFSNKFSGPDILAMISTLISTYDYIQEHYAQHPFIRGTDCEKCNAYVAIEGLLVKFNVWLLKYVVVNPEQRIFLKLLYTPYQVAPLGSKQSIEMVVATETTLEDKPICWGYAMMRNFRPTAPATAKKTVEELKGQVNEYELTKDMPWVNGLMNTNGKYKKKHGNVEAGDGMVFPVIMEDNSVANVYLFLSEHESASTPSSFPLLRKKMTIYHTAAKMKLISNLVIDATSLAVFKPYMDWYTNGKQLFLYAVTDSSKLTGFKDNSCEVAIMMLLSGFGYGGWATGAADETKMAETVPSLLTKLVTRSSDPILSVIPALTTISPKDSAADLLEYIQKAARSDYDMKLSVPAQAGGVDMNEIIGSDVDPQTALIYATTLTALPKYFKAATNGTSPTDVVNSKEYAELMQSYQDILAQVSASTDQPMRQLSKEPAYRDRRDRDENRGRAQSPLFRNKGLPVELRPGERRQTGRIAKEANIRTILEQAGVDELEEVFEQFVMCLVAPEKSNVQMNGAMITTLQAILKDNDLSGGYDPEHNAWLGAAASIIGAVKRKIEIPEYDPEIVQYLYSPINYKKLPELKGRAPELNKVVVTTLGAYTAYVFTFLKNTVSEDFKLRAEILLCDDLMAYHQMFNDSEEHEIYENRATAGGPKGATLVRSKSKKLGGKGVKFELEKGKEEDDEEKKMATLNPPPPAKTSNLSKFKTSKVKVLKHAEESAQPISSAIAVKLENAEAV